MPKITFNSFSSLANETSFLNALNENFSDLRTFLDTVFNRNGTSPNTLTAAVDANSQDINNVNVLRCTSLQIDGTLVVPGDLADVPAGTVPGDVIEDGGIDTVQLADGAVSAGKLGAALYKTLPKYVVRATAAGGVYWSSHAGITVTQNSTGRYTVTVPNAFADANSVVPVVSLESVRPNENKSAVWEIVDASTVRVNVRLISTASTDYDDNQFTLVLYGNLA